jgi:hypothetical protein
VKHVKLIGAIYVKPLASHEPIANKVKNFEQEQKNQELEEELEITLNF